MAYPADDHYAPAEIEWPATMIADEIIAEAAEYGEKNGYEAGIQILVHDMAFVFEDANGNIVVED